MPTKSTTSTIRTTSGKRLRLTPTRLIQIDHSSDNPWYVTKEDLKKAYCTNDSGIRIYEVRLGGNVRVHFSALDYEIGCCEFFGETFRRIVRYYGLRKSRSTKARA